MGLDREKAREGFRTAGDGDEGDVRRRELDRVGVGRCQPVAAVHPARRGHHQGGGDRRQVDLGDALGRRAAEGDQEDIRLPGARRALDLERMGNHG